MMDGDLQHPPGLIPTLLERWRAGSEIINTVRLGTEDISESKKFFSRLFYRVFNLLANVEIEPGNADFRLMSRAAVDVLNELPERHRFLRGLIPWIGFRQTRVEYQAPARWAGQSKYTFLKNIRFASRGSQRSASSRSAGDDVREPDRGFEPDLRLGGGGVALAGRTECAGMDVALVLRPVLRRQPARCAGDHRGIPRPHPRAGEGEATVHRPGVGGVNRPTWPAAGDSRTPLVEVRGAIGGARVDETSTGSVSF